MSLDDICKPSGTYQTKDLILNGRVVCKLTFITEFTVLSLKQIEMTSEIKVVSVADKQVEEDKE